MPAKRKIKPFLSACLNAFCLGAFYGLGNTVKIKPEITFTTDRGVNKAGKKLPDGIEIRFTGHIPSNDVRNRLKALGFKFSEKQQMWYAYDTAATREFVEAFQTELVEANVYTAPEGERQWFWAKVNNLGQWGKVPAQAAIKFMPSYGTFIYKTKQEFLDKNRSIAFSYIAAGNVYFKKFFQRKNEAAGEGEGEGQNTNTSTALAPQTALTPAQQTALTARSHVINGTVIGEKFFGMAAAMQSSIDYKLNPAIANQRPTRRRASIASSMRQDGLKLQKLQTELFALAWAHNTGVIQGYGISITKIRKKLEVENLNSNFISSSIPSNLQVLGIRTAYDWQFLQDQFKRLVSDYEKATNNANPNRSFQNKMAQLSQELREMEREIIGSKIPGFFPTPQPIIEMMLELCPIEEGDDVLEPSAGKGDICDAIIGYAQDEGFFDDIFLIAIEQNSRLTKIIEKRKELWVAEGLDKDKFVVMTDDFLQYNLSSLPRSNKIFMNPPFERGQDILHVAHAARFLKPYGKLVAVISEGSLSRSDKKSKAFKQWIDELVEYAQGTLSEPISNAFNTNQSFVQTGVTVRLLTVNCDYRGEVYELNQLLDNLGLNANGTIQNSVSSSTTQNTGEDEELEMLELEALAKIKILKLKNANAKAKANLQGFGNYRYAQNSRNSVSLFNKKY